MRRVYTVAVAIWLVASTAHAQQLFPRFDFHLDSEYATSADPRFNWLFNFGGDFDIVESSRVRAEFVADYEAIAGEQFRRFDVNAGGYLLEGALLFRAAGIEVGPVWHHVSRHLSDRPKRFPIDWNMISVSARVAGRRGAVDASWRADARKTVTNAYVDYDWELDVRGHLGYRLTTRFDITASSGMRVVGMDGSRGRGSQFGGRLEGGLRARGQRASAELFIGVERRVDPYPLEFSTASWFLTGLRLTSVP